MIFYLTLHQNIKKFCLKSINIIHYAYCYTFFHIFINIINNFVIFIKNFMFFCLLIYLYIHHYYFYHLIFIIYLSIHLLLLFNKANLQHPNCVQIYFSMKVEYMMKKCIFKIIF
jgi:hypothetical protein